MHVFDAARTNIFFKHSLHALFGDGYLPFSKEGKPFPLHRNRLLFHYRQACSWVSFREGGQKIFEKGISFFPPI